MLDRHPVQAKDWFKKNLDKMKNQQLLKILAWPSLMLIAQNCKFFISSQFLILSVFLSVFVFGPHMDSISLNDFLLLSECSVRLFSKFFLEKGVIFAFENRVF